MRVAFDASPLTPPRTGIGNVTHELVTRLARDPQLDLSAYCLGLRGRARAFAELPPGVSALERALPARPTRRAWLHTGVPRFEQVFGSYDLVHGTNFVAPPSKHPVLVTVHDMVSALHPEVVEPTSRLFPALIGAAIDRGAWVQVASHTVAAEVSAAYPIADERIAVIYNGVTPVAPADPGTGRKAAGFDNYVLAVGTIEPRKRLPDLVAAFDQIASRHDGLGLVIAGADGWGSQALETAIDSADHKARIRRLGWVESPAALMRGATVLAFPSLYEGFGLPPLEAMTAGVPVVATQAGALPEICGDAATLVPVAEVEELAAALDRVISDPDHRADLSRRGFERSASFSWDASAAEHAKLYKQLAQSR